MIQGSAHRPSQVVVDLQAIKHNIKLMQDKMSPDQELYAAVKANAYGHGAVAVSRAALEAGVDGLAVATVDEGIELRQAGIEGVPILVLGLTEARGIAEILLYDLTITVAEADFFDQAYQQLQATGQLDLLEGSLLKFHLALDTGMGRIGLRSREELEAFIEALEGHDWLDWQGVFTHFATASGGPLEYIDRQWQAWLDFLSLVPDSVHHRHYANSAMGLWYGRQPESTIVRYGIAMYGLDPMDRLPAGDWSWAGLANDQIAIQLDDLQPALSLTSELVYVKQIHAGDSISYGASYTAQETEWVGTVPVGYGDGWLRTYHSVALLVEGQPCQVLGRINMDQLMIRLPQYYPKGTTVTLIGRDGNYNNHASMLALKTDTIGYEIVTNLGQRLDRVYLEERED